MIPSVSVKKSDFQTGVARPSPTGVGVIIAASSTGTNNQPAGYARDALAVAALGYGPLTEYGSYGLQVGGNPVVLEKCAASIAGACGAVTTVGTGTSAITASGAAFDEYNIFLNFLTGGTIGVAGITYNISLDGNGGGSTSGTTALGTANTIAPANTGVTIGLGAGTILAGTTAQFFTTRPQPNNADLAPALTALGNCRIPWEAVLVDVAYNVGTVGQLDTWETGLEAKGQFHLILMNTRHKNNPVPTAESEAAYLTAMTTLTQNDASINVAVGTDAAAYTSSLTGVSQPRPTAMFLLARIMAIPVGEDPAFSGRGNIPGATIADGNGNPYWHDEDLYPGLDALRLTTLRSFAPGGPQGVYFCNANLLSPNGSDYVWVQHARCMNLACGIAWSVLSGLLSVGVGKQAPDPVTNGVYIAEHDAQRIEGQVNAALRTPMKNQVVQVVFVLSRTDDLSSNSSATVNGNLEIESLAYLKKYQIQASFVKSIAVPTHGGQAPSQESP